MISWNKDKKSTGVLPVLLDIFCCLFWSWISSCCVLFRIFFLFLFERVGWRRWFSGATTLFLNTAFIVAVGLGSVWSCCGFLWICLLFSFEGIRWRRRLPGSFSLYMSFMLPFPEFFLIIPYFFPVGFFPGMTLLRSCGFISILGSCCFCFGFFIGIGLFWALRKSRASA